MGRHGRLLRRPSTEGGRAPERPIAAVSRWSAVSSIYADGTYLERNPTWHAEDAGWKAQQILAMLARHGLAPRSIGEIGCGSGELLVHLSESLPIGVDLHGW